MSLMSFLHHFPCLLCLSVFLPLLSPSSSEWVDPYAGGFITEYDQPVYDLPQQQTMEECLKSSPCYHYMTRFVNLLLRATGLQDHIMKKDDAVRTVTLELQVTGWQLRTLQKFGEGDVALSDSVLDSMDRALTELLVPMDAPIFRWDASSTKMFDSTFTTASTYISHVTPMGIISFIIASLILLLSWNLYCGHSVFRTCIFLYLIIFILVFGWSCSEKYFIKEAQIKAARTKHEGSIPKECTPSKMGYWDKIFATFQSEDLCEQYFINMEVPALSLAEIGYAFRDTVRIMFFETLGGIGSFLNMACSFMASGLPWPFNYVAYLVLILVFPLWLICVNLTHGRDIKLQTLFGRFELTTPSTLDSKSGFTRFFSRLLDRINNDRRAPLRLGDQVDEDQVDGEHHQPRIEHKTSSCGNCSIGNRPPGDGVQILLSADTFRKLTTSVPEINGQNNGNTNLPAAYQSTTQRRRRITHEREQGGGDASSKLQHAQTCQTLAPLSRHRTFSL